MAGDQAREHELEGLRRRVARLTHDLATAAGREAELRESEARFRILAEESLAGVYVIQDRRFAYVNQRGAELFGTTRDAVEGADIESLVMPESLPVVEENIRKRLAGEIRSMHYRLRVRHASGEPRECEVLGSLAEWAGRPAIIGTAIDRTDDVRQQAMLEDQTRILQRILECMGDGVAVTDASGEFIIFNPAARRITGLGPQGRTPEEWTEAYGVFTGDGVTPVRPGDLPLARAMRGEATDGVELFLRNPSNPAGTWIRVTGRPLVDAAGDQHGGVVVFHDTTDRRRMIDRLQHAESQYRNLVEQLPVIVYTAPVGGDGAVDYVSPQVESILGFAPDEWTRDAATWARQLHRDDRERVLDELRRCRRTGDKFVCEYRIHAKDGRVVWLHDEAVLLRDGAGGDPVVQGLLLDVSEREAERSGRMRLQAWSSDLVRVQEQERRRIGLELHDGIGQVLTGLRLRLAALRHAPVEPPATALVELERLVDEAIESVRALSQSVRPAVLDDLGLLPALVSHVDHWSRQTSIRVDLEHSGIERRRFHPEAETAAYRIVQEALTNVARHAGTGSARVRAGADDATLCVEVEDPGVGFDADLLSPDQAMHGIGGMRERVGLLGGRLVVESLPGCGCRLRAEIPLQPQTRSAEATP